MRYLNGCVVAVMLCELLIGCGASTAQSSPGSVPSKISQQSLQARGIGGATPAPGGHITGVLQTQGTAHPAPMLFPDNSKEAPAHFVSTAVAERAAGLGTIYGAKLHLKGAQLMRMAQTDVARGGQPAFISPNRMVYQLSTTFSTDYGVHGNHWSSGTRIFAVDAETGKVLGSSIHGNMTASSQAERLKAARLYKRSPAFIR